ncbi:Actin family protein [Rhynchospora pubera]|uniref:Actin family protein n=1 Tax=Rhynchospora pubera TaxID=906938 RepID=A0AAV8DV06_9POAL|nr:Actin family protein [Rhynchospora pubera]
MKMAFLLKKVWGFVIIRSGLGTSSSSSTSRSTSVGSTTRDILCNSGSLGALDQLPTDVIMQILHLLGPRETARLAVVCRYFRVLVSDNKLWMNFLQNGKDSWDCIAFSETHLHAGPPSEIYYDHPVQLSFMSVYAKRTLVPGAVIIDGGSGYCKYGWSKFDSPSGRCATFLEFGNIESPMYARLRHFFSTIYNRMQVKPSSQPVILAIPICHCDDTESARASRRQYREAIFSVLFDMNVPAICAIDQAVLALYASKKISGIVVNVGFNITSVVPVYRGKVMHEIGVEIVGIGALKLTGFLKELMQRRSMTYESLYTVRTIKEKLCYVALDYEAEMRKDTTSSCEVSGEGWFTLSQERFQVGELLFQPQLGGVRAMALHQAVGLCIDHCYNSDIVGDVSWYKTVILAGGTGCLPGLPERLEKELSKLLPESMSEGIKVSPPPYGTDSAWFGAKIVSNVSTFTEAWCVTKKRFQKKYKMGASSIVSSW